MTRIFGVDHIGIAVHSIEQEMERYKRVFGLKHLRDLTIENQGVKIAIFDAHNVKLELIEPIGQDSKIHKFIEKNGPGIHHIAFQVHNLESYIAWLELKGKTIIGGRTTEGINHSMIAFLHPKMTGNVLFELCKKPSDGR